jgi:hypothetical protein
MEKKMSIPENEQVEDPCEYMADLAKTRLPLNRWNFNESYRSKKEGRLIFDSQWCRMKLVWSGWEMYGGNTISVYYGRLHAPDDSQKMKWKGEECHCWHREGLALHFLDERTPKYAASTIHDHALIQEYRESELGKSLGGKRRQPEWLVRMQAMIWGHYAPRLFELFDLRRPELWEQYRQFVKEVYAIKGMIPEIKPAEDKVC